MSKYIKGYMGDQIGKLGTAVGYRWKGRSVMRAYQKFVRNPNTESQQIARARFSTLVALSKAFRWGVKVGMNHDAANRGLTEQNLFVKLNKSEVTVVSPDDISVNYSGLALTKGDLPEASFGQVDFGSGQHLQISAPLNGGSDQPGADDDDDVYLFAYCPEKKQGVLGSAAKRSAASVAVNVPASWDGMDIHVYGFAVGGKETLSHGQSSPTTYCGSGEVA